MNVEEQRRKLVGPTAQLIELLRDVNRAGSPVVCDVECYEAVGGSITRQQVVRVPAVP